jgi:hypothetical protein
MFHAASTALMLIQRLAKYILQPSQITPDYGKKFETAVRSSSYGTILMTLNITDNVQIQTWSLAPYLIAGQQIIRYSATWRGIAVSMLAAGTGTDTVQMEPGAAIFYVFPAGPGEFIQPTIRANLSDQPNAAKVAVRYGYDRYLFDSSLAYTFDCGIGSCTLPVDRSIGTVYYRLIYLDSIGKVVATSDVETL